LEITQIICRIITEKGTGVLVQKLPDQETSLSEEELGEVAHGAIEFMEDALGFEDAADPVELLDPTKLAAQNEEPDEDPEIGEDEEDEA